MKTFLICIIASICVQLQAQTNTPIPAGRQLTQGVQPPVIVSTNFSTAYPNVSAEWTLLEDVYSAEYRDPNTNRGRVVTYDQYGNLVSTENELQANAYPKSIDTYYAKKFPGEKYTTWSYEDELGNKMYYILRGEQSTWFSTEGKFIPNTNGKKKTSRQVKYAESR